MIGKLIRKIKEKNIKMQVLNHSITKIEDRKRKGYTEVTFATTEATCNDLANFALREPKKTALILWVDTDILNEAFEELPSGKK